MKRFLSMILAVALLAVLFLPLSLAEDNELDAGTYYVYTANGLSLNVRDQPSFKGAVVGGLRYGSRIHVVTFTDENWALITYNYNKPGYGPGDYACWVYRRFLTKSKPDPWTPDAKKSKEQAAEPADPLEELNKEFSSAKDVEDYVVTTRPTRVTGWVSMHWAPSVSAEIQATYKANDKLLVIKELDNWLQVEDQVTGNVGFIKKSLVNE